MKASILTIGDEILIGQIVDTNSASIARHLNNAGIVVWERTSVGDQREQITEAVKRAMNQSDVVILTGGLGPTKDDITKKDPRRALRSRLVCDQTVADHVRRMLEARGIEYNRLNRDQRSSRRAAPCFSTPTARPPACGSNRTAKSWFRCRASPSKWST